MKALILILCSLTYGYSLTEICGRIEIPTSLIKSESPYLVTGDIYVPPDSRLTIESGVKVLISSTDVCKSKTKQLDYSDSTMVSIKVDGSFYIEGMPDQRVTIEPQNFSPGQIGWDGIRIWNGNRLSTQIQFATIRGANKGVHIMNSKFNIANSIFEYNNYGIELLSTANVAIFNSEFVENLLAGIFQKSSSPKIYANIFYKNFGHGIWSDSRTSLHIRYNNFWENGEIDCYHCPYPVKQITGTNWLGDSTDVYMNQFVDPFYQESQTTKAKEKVDFDIATPLAEVTDSLLAQKILTARNRYQTLGISWKKGFKVKGEGKYRLSKYSTLTGAAPDDPYFYDEEGKRVSIGVQGGVLDRVKKIFPFD